MNNRRPFVYLFIFTIFCASSVQADIISLKNGKKIEGFILNETESEFTVKTLTGGVVKVKKDNNIVEIKIGYSGISACYTLESDPETVSTCSKLLIYLDGKKAVFAKKDSSENPVTIFLDKLQKIEILKPSSEFLAQVIKADVDLDFHYAGDSKKGRLIAMKNRKINLELRNGARVVADLNDMRM
ncbi:MAG: hypothetical protein IT569_06790, partial [Leptospiraceae bacterium]|nr:hypothetical protein [Leptospiraceae bacterium]